MTETARILVVAPSAYFLGGLATWLDYLLPGLTELGWDVTLGLVSGPRHHQPQCYLDVHPFERTIRIHCGCSTTAGRIQAVRSAIRQSKPDVVLTVNIPDALKATALERSNGRSVRAVMTCHGIQEDLFADMRLLTLALDAVVCTNQLACRLAAAISGLTPDRIFHCAYGTAVCTHLPARPASETFTIGYSGRLEQPQKRIHDLVAIALRLRDTGQSFRFLVAGSGPEEQPLRASIQAHGLSDRFELMGFIAPEQLADRFYKVVDALLVTSSWETGPIVIWEAMAVGTPIVTSRYTGSGLERLLWDRQNCLMFDIGATSDAAAQILALIDNEHLRQQLRHQAFRDVSERLSCRVSLNNWDTILRQIVQTAPRSDTVNDLPSSRNSGRLSRFAGERAAGLIRWIMRKLPPDMGPGGEWPHTIAGSTMDEDEFFELATSMDRREEVAVDPAS